jgi:hypothetical protein
VTDGAIPGDVEADLTAGLESQRDTVRMDRARQGEPFGKLVDARVIDRKFHDLIVAGTVEEQAAGSRLSRVSAESVLNGRTMMAPGLKSSTAV